MKSTLSIMIAVGLLLGFSTAAMGVVVPHGDVTYLNIEHPAAGSAFGGTHQYPGSPTLNLTPGGLYASMSDSDSESADQLTDGVVTATGDPSISEQMVFWQEDRSDRIPYPDAGWDQPYPLGHGTDDPYWDGAYPQTKFNLGGVYGGLNSIDIWSMEWGNIGYPGMKGIEVSFSLDDVSYSTPVLYNSAPYAQNGSAPLFVTVTETIGYNDPGGFQYVLIEFQPLDGPGDINGGWSAGFLAIGEVTFDANAVPEPATMALLGLGGMMVLVRRRR